MFYSIIVTYHHDSSHLLEMCKALNAAKIGVIIFDNTPDISSPIKISKLMKENFSASNNIDVVGDGVNYGLSTAFNRSMKVVIDTRASTEGFLFFDQDSTLTSEKLISLLNEYRGLKKFGVPIGVLGALPVNETGSPYLVKESNKTHSFINERDYILANFVISSFSLIPKSTIDKVGFFDEQLFIDLVDSEFSYRCTKYGLLNLVSKNVSFTHVIGENTGYLYTRKFAISSPLRNYYQARNLILVGKKYNRPGFILTKIPKRFIQVVLSAYYSGNLFKRLKYFSYGIFDGIYSRGGNYSDHHSSP